MPDSDNEFLYTEQSPYAGAPPDSKLLEAWETPKSAFEKGQSLANQGDWVNAARWYARVVQLAPSVEAGHFNLANAFFELQRYEDAAREYRQALDLVDDPATWNNLGNTLCCMFRFDEAIRAYNSGLVGQEHVAGVASQSCFNRARAQLALDQYEAAAESFRLSWEKHPGNPRPVERYLKTLAILERWEEGRRFGEEALQIASCRVEACSGLAALYEAQDRWDLAISFLVQAAEWSPEDPRPFARLAQHHSMRGRISEATACIHRAASLVSSPPAELYSHWIQMLQGSETHAASKVRDEAKKWRAKAPNLPFAEGRGNIRLTKGEAVRASLDGDAARGLTIGILANDDVSDAVIFQLLPYLQGRDRASHRVHLYWCSLDNTPLQKRLRELVDRWVPCHQSTDNSIAWMLRSQKTDLLVDMIGHGPSTRIGVAKLVPDTVAVLWNYAQQTTGQPEYAFRMSLGAEQESHRSEATESSFTVPFPSLPKLDSLESSTAELQAAVSEATLRFGFAGPMKRMTHESLDGWASVLAAFPNAIFEIASEDLHRQGTRNEILQGFERRGIQGSRIRLDGIGKNPSLPDIAEWISTLDMYLCSWPIASMPESLLALSVGTPILGHAGDSSARSSVVTLKKMLPNSVFAVGKIDEAIEELQGILNDILPLRARRQERVLHFQKSTLANPDGYARAIDVAWNAMLEQVHDR